MPNRRHRGALLALTVVLGFAAAGCRVDVHVRAALHEGGAGTLTATVSLDEEAVGRLERNGRTLESAVLLDDLRAAGWEAAWERDGSGARLVLAHGFSGEDELNARLRELAGDTGAVRDGHVVDEDGFVRSREAISFTGDRRALEVGIGDDAALADALEAAGLDVAALDEELGAQLGDALVLRITAQAPGGRLETVTVDAGDERRVSAARSTIAAGRLVTVGIAAILAFLGGLLYLAAAMSARRDRARRGPEPERHPLM
ncbi:MAG: hypothetical protein KatS3mg009_0786 [Acidimicrobiia bacterium]|nr:MAG: hypothetical protein KatS3mg009_0786 [Acidimicrobiia bacterium]